MIFNPIYDQKSINNNNFAFIGFMVYPFSAFGTFFFGIAFALKCWNFQQFDCKKVGSKRRKFIHHETYACDWYTPSEVCRSCVFLIFSAFHHYWWPTHWPYFWWINVFFRISPCLVVCKDWIFACSGKKLRPAVGFES